MEGENPTLKETSKTNSNMTSKIVPVIDSTDFHVNNLEMKMAYQNLKTTLYFQFLMRAKNYPHKELLVQQQRLQKLTAQIIQIQTTTL